MTRASDSLEAALRSVASGNWDALTPEQVERLERVLNAEPALARRLADERPVLDTELADALAALDQQTRPAPRVWARVWERIGATRAATRGPLAGRGRRILRLWAPLTAVAACILLTLLWALRPASAAPWPLRLATNVEIDALEVPEGATSLVISTGGENAAQVIWVLEDQG